ncbi:hypothetical protein HDU90_002145 [Geranomyces variabilis]|nr:hypothetical protein HDU90_002145 [Geranomyces variabilis]
MLELAWWVLVQLLEMVGGLDAPHCMYCGVEMNVGAECGDPRPMMTKERVVPTLGYANLSNLRVVCIVCNYFKRTLSLEALRNFFEEEESRAPLGDLGPLSDAEVAFVKRLHERHKEIDNAPVGMRRLVGSTASADEYIAMASAAQGTCSITEIRGEWCHGARQLSFDRIVDAYTPTTKRTDHHAHSADNVRVVLTGVNYYLGSATTSPRRFDHLKAWCERIKSGKWRNAYQWVKDNHTIDSDRATQRFQQALSEQGVNVLKILDDPRDRVDEGEAVLHSGDNDFGMTLSGGDADALHVGDNDLMMTLRTWDKENKMPLLGGDTLTRSWTSSLSFTVNKGSQQLITNTLGKSKSTGDESSVAEAISETLEQSTIEVSLANTHTSGTESSTTNTINKEETNNLSNGGSLGSSLNLGSGGSQTAGTENSHTHTAGDAHTTGKSDGTNENHEKHWEAGGGAGGSIFGISLGVQASGGHSDSNGKNQEDSTRHQWLKLQRHD